MISDFKSSVLGYEYLNRSFSQNGEDLVLSRLLENHPKGRYIDVGVHHPFRFSNTANLYYSGWIGTNVDADPASMENFTEVRTNEENICAALGSKQELLSYYSYKETALNTLSEKRMKFLENYGLFPTKVDQIEVKKASEFLTQIFTYDTYLLNIDVEGLDFEILAGLDIKFFYPCFILIETQELSIEQFDAHTKADPFLSNYHMKSFLFNTAILKSDNCAHQNDLERR